MVRLFFLVRVGAAVISAQIVVPPPGQNEFLPSGVGDGISVETIPGRFVGGQYVYVAKYICGVAVTGLCLVGPCRTTPPPPPPPFPITLVDGLYLSSVNILNANAATVTVSTRSVKLTRRTNPAIPGSAAVQTALAPDTGFSFNCVDITGPAANGLPVTEGMVIIRAAQPLNVISVNTLKNLVGVVRKDP